jgi:hypothetical protein
VSFKNRYGLLDRMVHRIAFGTTWAQRGTADLEERLFQKELAALELGPPVLITGLPRAGTTILLELLAQLDAFAAHTYRDMPFVLCPMLWSRISKPFQKSDAPRERAHGDGMQLTQDSPEAFEEMLWQLFFKQHYRGTCIAPWQRCDDEEFVEFFRSHMRKIVALRARQKPTAHRYVSKNNLNIARIPAIWGAVPDAQVLVPFREPLQHAASLLRQHERFSAMHKEDAFARRYMAGIGHHDFGANLKPINFSDWFAGRSVSQAFGIGFWIDYWIASYQHVLAHANHAQLHLICFEALGQQPDLRRLADCLQLPDASALQVAAKTLRAARPHEIATHGVPTAKLEQAQELYRQLRNLALI